MSDNETVDMNVRISELPVETNRKLNAIAARAGKHKYEVVREALIEYAAAHELDGVKTA